MQQVGLLSSSDWLIVRFNAKSRIFKPEHFREIKYETQYPKIYECQI
jgi:hypothetical protein